MRLAAGDVGHEREVHLHLAVELGVEKFLLRLAFGQRRGGFHLADASSVAGAAFGGIREQGDARFDVSKRAVERPPPAIYTSCSAADCIPPHPP